MIFLAKDLFLAEFAEFLLLGFWGGDGLFFAHGFGWGDACDEVGWAYEHEYGGCGEADVDK